ncbi:MAG TPA: hypothetical protein PK222_01700 [Bacteroidales bacterium]|nr:hypothetical protein [Bacteroidales bacterium]HPC09864.1 hypothetical protein [archaeon]HRT02895.1 hypothetical protein [Candidatus Diapherotrites archaeon]
MTRKIYYKRPDRVGLDFISSDATTFGELKKEFSQQLKLNLDDMIVIVREGFITLSLNEAILPNTEFTLLLYKSKQKGGIDYSKLSYKELQNLAKSYKIPANLSKIDLIFALNKVRRSEEKNKKENLVGVVNLLFINNRLVDLKNELNIIIKEIEKLTDRINNITLISDYEYHEKLINKINKDYKDINEELK